jgi:hypothetical protein
MDEDVRAGTLAALSAVGMAALGYQATRAFQSGEFVQHVDSGPETPGQAAMTFIVANVALGLLGKTLVELFADKTAPFQGL